MLGRRSNVTVKILRSNGQVAQTLISNKAFPIGEQTVVWDGRIGNGFAPPGSYTYECTARDASTSETTTLRGQITIVPQTPLDPVGVSSFTDVSAKDWFSGYLAVAEKQNLMIGYPDKTFHPRRSINRVEATAVVVRALGLEDVARRANVQDVGFLDEQNIPAWAKAYVYVATSIARTRTGKLMIGYPSNFYLPMKALRRDEAALIVQRLIDKETNRRIAVSGRDGAGRDGFDQWPHRRSRRQRQVLVRHRPEHRATDNRRRHRAGNVKRDVERKVAARVLARRLFNFNHENHLCRAGRCGGDLGTSKVGVSE